MARPRSRKIAALPSSHVEGSRCPSRLIACLHSGPSSARCLICYNIKVSLIFFIISHHRHVMTPIGTTCPPVYVFSIAGVSCNSVKLGMSLHLLGRRDKSLTGCHPLLAPLVATARRGSASVTGSGSAWGWGQPCAVCAARPGTHPLRISVTQALQPHQPQSFTSWGSPKYCRQAGSPIQYFPWRGEAHIVPAPF